jgi:hypothetical protein
MSDQVYTAVVGALGFYGLLMKEIVKDFGWDKAMDMSARIGREFGVTTGEEIQRCAVGKKLDIIAVETYNASMMDELGMGYTAKRTGNSVSFEITRCTLYDALKASGFDHAQIGRLCEAFDSTYYGSVASVVPGVAASVVFRPTPEGCCKERWEVR